MQFNVCSYNMGSGSSDYLNLHTYFNPQFKIGSREQEQAFINEHAKIEESSAISLQDKANAYCLQEVVDENRPLIKNLKEKGFEIIHLNNDQPYFDAAIALDKNRFKDIVNHSMVIDRKDVAIATATDILTNQKVTFVSAHVPGFNLENLIEEEKQDGDNFCQKLATNLRKIGGTQIIGADMNGTTEIANERFQAFTKNGLLIHKTDCPTNVCPRSEDYKLREFDYFFAKNNQSFWQKIKSIFKTTIQYSCAIKKGNCFGLDEGINPSDHAPIFLKVKPKECSSKMKTLSDRVRSSLDAFFKRFQRQVNT